MIFGIGHIDVASPQYEQVGDTLDWQQWQMIFHIEHICVLSHLCEATYAFSAGMGGAGFFPAGRVGSGQGSKSFGPGRGGAKQGSKSSGRGKGQNLRGGAKRKYLS